MKNSSSPPRLEAHQTVRLNIDTKDATSSIRISFTDQRLTAHGGMIVWSHFLFGRAAVWSRAQGKPTLKLAVQGLEHRSWWREIFNKLTALPNCNAVESLQA